MGRSRKINSLRAAPTSAPGSVLPHSASPGAGYAPPGFACPGCQVRAETIEFLRDQLRQAQLANTQMQEKFLSLVGDAAEKYHRIKMTEMAQQHQGITDGVVPMEAIDDDDKMLDEFMNGFMNGGPQ